LNHAYSSKAPASLQAKIVKPATGSVDRKSGAIHTFSRMTSILGIIIVFACIAAGYLMEHGKLLALIQPAELGDHFGFGGGRHRRRESPASGVKRVLKAMAGVLSGPPCNKRFYAESPHHDL
jgi:hypothetical protein